MKTLARQQIRIIADNNNVSALDMHNERVEFTKQNIRFFKKVTFTFIILLSIVGLYIEFFV